MTSSHPFFSAPLAPERLHLALYNLAQFCWKPLSNSIRVIACAAAGGIIADISCQPEAACILLRSHLQRRRQPRARTAVAANCKAAAMRVTETEP